jgi:hypothetical protein
MLNSTTFLCLYLDFHLASSVTVISVFRRLRFAKEVFRVVSHDGLTCYFQSNILEIAYNKCSWFGL